jgi:hypothetical protein
MRRPGPEAGFAAGAAALATVGAAIVMKLWDADLRAPFSYTGDGTLNLMLIKGVMERGWFYENPRLGAPNGQQLYDYPVLSGDGLHVLFFWLGGLFTDDPALVMNVFFLLTFPVTAVVGYLVLRRLTIGPEVSVVIAVLYALLPYHFMRGETHLFLAAYYAVPVGVYLVLCVFDGRRFTLGLGALAALVALASGSFYYSAFTVVLVVVAAALHFLLTRERGGVVCGALVVGVILGVSLVQLAPTIVYRAANGTNDEVAKRFWFESENYGLKITHLVLPVDGHRIDALAARKEEYVEQIPPNEGRAATLGAVASAGFLWLLAVAVVAIAGAWRRYDLGMHARLAVLTVVSVLLATTGGLSTLIAVVWPQIRSWNRLSVFIAFFALVAVALLLEWLGRRIPRTAFLAVLAAVLVLGAADQTTDFFVPPYDGVEADYRDDQRWILALEDQLPDRAMVVQLPYEPFPEPPLGPRPLYESAKPYLHSSDLQWSFGAMKGRPDDWAVANATRPVAELVPAAREAGFAAIHVDRLAYPDQGAAVEDELRSALGAEPERSGNGRYLLWRL